MLFKINNVLLKIAYFIKGILHTVNKLYTTHVKQALNLCAIEKLPYWKLSVLVVSYIIGSKTFLHRIHITTYLCLFKLTLNTLIITIPAMQTVNSIQNN